MLKSFAKNITKVSVIRRLLFAASHLPTDLPNYWKIVADFATEEESQDYISVEQVRVLLENLQELNCAAFKTDTQLLKELVEFPLSNDRPIGLVLVSDRKNCLSCNSKLLVRRDRPATVIVYTDSMGSVTGSHFHKYCINTNCHFVQYYGYYTSGGSSQVYYNQEWRSLPYFISSRETVFSISLLNRFNAEILLGQMSFKQCADVYNHINGYDIKNKSR